MKEFDSDLFKIYESIYELNKVLEKLGKSKTIVYTYGVWDLFHPGHALLLSRAKKLGDFLIVGTVADAPVKKLKGDLRPVQSQDDRIVTVGSLRFVDAAVHQKKYNPSDVLAKLFKVDILAKGDDWDYIPGQETIKSRGGNLVKLSYSRNYSSSSLVSKMSGKRVKKNKEF